MKPEIVLYTPTRFYLQSLQHCIRPIRAQKLPYMEGSNLRNRIIAPVPVCCLATVHYTSMHNYDDDLILSL